MKVTIFATSCVGLIGLIVWLKFGWQILLLISLLLLTVALLIVAFGLGCWWSGKLMERGATLALQARGSDDRRETMQINALASLMKEAVKSGQAVGQPTLPYPRLPLEEVVEANFTIAGLDDETGLSHPTGLSSPAQFNNP